MNHKSTSELLHVLTNIDSEKNLETYVSDSDHFSDISFSDYYNSLPGVKQLKYTELIKQTGIERTYFYQIMNKKRRPGRDKVILLALAACLTLTETQRALELSGLGILYSRSRRDAILIFAINKKLGVQNTQELLEKFGEKVLS